MKYDSFFPTYQPAEKANASCTMPSPQQKQVLAMAYVPVQPFQQTYDPEQAWSNGTLFPELNKPFLGGGLYRER